MYKCIQIYKTGLQWPATESDEEDCRVCLHTGDQKGQSEVRNSLQDPMKVSILRLKDLCWKPGHDIQGEGED